MALKANIDEEQISCNLERASTVIKDLYVAPRTLHLARRTSHVYFIKNNHHVILGPARAWGGGGFFPC